MTQHKKIFSNDFNRMCHGKLCIIVNTEGTDSTHALQAPNLKHVLQINLGETFLQDCLLVVA